MTVTVTVATFVVDATKPFYAYVGAAESAVEAVRKAAEEKELRSPLQRGYLPVIRFATTWRWTTVLIGILVLAGTFAL